jgi:hypothetical protein
VPTKTTTLADGQLANSEAEVFLAGSIAGKRVVEDTVVTSFSVFNTSATPQTVIVYVRRASTGTSRKYRQYSLAQNESADVFTTQNAIKLSPGDSLRAETTTASVVDYVVAGEISK